MLSKNKVRFTILLILSLIWLFPLVAMLVFSLAPNEEILRMSVFPSTFTFANYIQAFTSQIRGVNIPSSLYNSAIILIIQVSAIIALDAPAAYALARFKFKGRNIIFYIILMTMMMPGHIMLISLYILISNAGLIDTLSGIILPGLPRVMGIFLLRQFFMQIPQEIEDSANVDGANKIQTFFKIMLPMAIPAIATLTVITVLYSWNNFLWPLIVSNSPSSMTAPIAMAYLNSGTNATQNYSTLLAGAFITSLPMILFFLIAQKWIIKGIAPTSGID